jgi:hypothetical protein
VNAQERMHAAENKTGEYWGAYQEAKSQYESLRKDFNKLENKHKVEVQLNDGHVKN